MKIRLLTLFFVGLAYTSSYAQQDSITVDTTDVKLSEEIVVTASKQGEKILQSPVSIERMTLEDIKQTGQPSFFDAIGNLKAVQMITPSLGFKVINARGFTNTTNVRFVQMVDGMDNQAPHIGAPIANSLGPNDLDIYRVEVLPGSSSALYGMNAINGTANFITKDAFDFQGLSFQNKVGVNHLNDIEQKATPYNETSLRYSKAFKDKFAFKLNGTYTFGNDWNANNQMDLNPNANTSTNLLGNENPGKDYVNIYGDEAANRRTLTLGGKRYVVSRTGYAEKYVTDYDLKNFKGDVTLCYRITKDVELKYVYRFANLNTTYQRTNRFRLEDYVTQQNALSLKSGSIQFKAYVTSENTGNSYNIRSMAENIDRGYKSDNQWFKDFTTQFNSLTSSGMSVTNAMTEARNLADSGRPTPGTQQFSDQISSLRQINNWDIGAALKVKAYLSHAEFQHNLTNKIFLKIKERYNFNVMYGADFRNYSIIPDGNYFINPIDPGKVLNYWKVGGFIQATKFLWKEKIKINGVLRVDKNQYFEPKLNPRLAVVYSPKKEHNFRMSYQQGYRFPSIFEAFSNINSGGVKRVGGLPVMSNGIFENSYTRASIDAFQRAVTNDVNTGGLTQTAAILKNQDLLKENNYTYIKPEQVTSLEVGYRTLMFKGLLSADIDFYYNNYQNLIAQVEANVPKTSNPDSIAFYLNDRTKQDRYRLWTNSNTVTYNYGSAFGLTLYLPRKFQLGGNVTLSRLDRQEQSDGLEDGFNTPKWITNISFSNPALYKSLGFSINYRWQDAYLWQSALATGDVPAYSNLDAQINYGLFKNKIQMKFGASNLLNKYYYSFIGGPAVGGFYYCNIIYNVF